MNCFLEVITSEPLYSILLKIYKEKDITLFTASLFMGKKKKDKDPRKIYFDTWEY